MYAKLKLGNIQFGEVKVGEIEIEGKYKLEEIVGLYALTKTAIKEMPELLDDLAKTADKVMGFEERVQEKANTEDLVKTTMDNILKDIRSSFVDVE